MWGEGREGSGVEDQESLTYGVHDSWVSKFEERFDAPEVNIQGEGRDGSFTDPEANVSSSESSFGVGEGREGSGVEDQESLSFGVHDSWVSAFEKELAEGTRPAYNPTVREQGAGAHDSWVSRFSEAATIDPVNISGEGREGTDAPETKAKNEASNPFKVTPSTPGESDYSDPAGRPGQSAHDSWVNAFKKELVKGEGKSWKAAPVQSSAASGGSFSAAPVQSAPVQQDKFVGQWNFRVVIDNIPDDNCKLLSISGITMETEPIEFKRNNSNRVETIPGRIKCGNIEFTKVVNLGGDSFSQWREQIEAGDDAFRTIQVHLHHVDMSADPVMSVTLHNAWPVKWEFPELSGSSSDAAIEKITFDVSHITRS